MIATPIPFWCACAMPGSFAQSGRLYWHVTDVNSPVSTSLTSASG